MSTKDDGGPAFPVFDMAKCQAQGMTMRYWFAGQFLETYVADGIPKAEKQAKTAGFGENLTGGKRNEHKGRWRAGVSGL